ncbi:hypothetical protein O6H91_18G000900 [Diphasiastrum complanatum]|uniref:Uncharacterized protein n=1 Tax=Diphasiastrum complanatum TaxID=34168 RepID=A0ACC2AXL9_DIPCM|nr:hypothetical protein O6H91_18G000900 [Diphasiastrum complanatum]
MGTSNDGMGRSNDGRRSCEKQMVKLGIQSISSFPLWKKHDPRAGIQRFLSLQCEAGGASSVANYSNINRTVRIVREESTCYFDKRFLSSNHGQAATCRSRFHEISEETKPRIKGADASISQAISYHDTCKFL